MVHAEGTQARTSLARPTLLKSEDEIPDIGRRRSVTQVNLRPGGGALCQAEHYRALVYQQSTKSQCRTGFQCRREDSLCLISVAGDPKAQRVLEGGLKVRTRTVCVVDVFNACASAVAGTAELLGLTAIEKKPNLGILSEFSCGITNSTERLSAERTNSRHE